MYYFRQVEVHYIDSEVIDYYCKLLVLDHYEGIEDYSTCIRIKESIENHLPTKLDDSEFNTLPRVQRRICKSFARKIINDEKWTIGKHCK